MRVQTGLSFVAGFTAKNMPLHVSPHLRPKEVISEYLLYFLGTKVAHKSTRMSFLHKQNAKRTIWNAELLARNKNPSCKWNFSHPLPLQHLEYGSAKY